MDEMPRDAAVDRLEAIVSTVEAEVMPVPIREIWAFGDLALGLDPVERLEVYVCKDMLLDGAPVEEGPPGVGETVRAEWAAANPEHVRTNDAGHVAPERCLAAHLLEADEPVHLEVCNARFEDNVTQRLRGAQATGDFTRILDPRGVCCWVEGTTSETALEHLREGSLALPTLPRALELLGLEAETAERATEEYRTWRGERTGTSLRADVV